jgi:RimJ/RimL family protein N-acetyltransferase
MTQQANSARALLTPRLTLLNITPQTIRAEQTGLAQLSEALGIPLAKDWPPEPWEPHVLDYLLEKWELFPNSTGWNRYIALNNIDGQPSLLIGGVGSTTPLEELGEVEELPAGGEIEIGYSLVPSCHRQGYAPEAVEAFTSWLFQHPQVKSICAQTFPRLSPSIRVLEKNGFQFAGPGKEEGCILYRKLRL